MSKRDERPFGFSFVYKPDNPPLRLPDHNFDYMDGINYVEDSTGKRIPLVEWSPTGGTSTVTFVEKESNDEDYSMAASSATTATVTKVDGESSDEDYHSQINPHKTTHTATAIEAENPDADDGVLAFPNSPIMITDTITWVEGEEIEDGQEMNSNYKSIPIGLLRTSTETKADGESTDQE